MSICENIDNKTDRQFEGGGGIVMIETIVI